MKWEEVKKLYPDQYVLLEELKSLTKFSKNLPPIKLPFSRSESVGGR